jgi:hypothetical protein
VTVESKSERTEWFQYIDSEVEESQMIAALGGWKGKRERE